MKTQTTKVQSSNQTLVKNLDPRGSQNVKAGLSINFTKIEYKYTPYDDQHK